MREASHLKIFLIAMATCAGLIATLCLTFWLDAACQVEGRRIAMKSAGSTGCFEFWLNRYQQMVGTLVAGAIAVFALIPVMRQLRLTNMQTAVATSAALRQRIIELEAERSFASDLKSSLIVFDAARREDPAGDHDQAARDICREYTSRAEPLELKNLTSPRGETYTAITDALRVINRLGLFGNDAGEASLVRLRAAAEALRMNTSHDIAILGDRVREIDRVAAPLTIG